MASPLSENKPGGARDRGLGPHALLQGGPRPGRAPQLWQVRSPGARPVRRPDSRGQVRAPLTQLAEPGCGPSSLTQSRARSYFNQHLLRPKESGLRTASVGHLEPLAPAGEAGDGGASLFAKLVTRLPLGPAFSRSDRGLTGARRELFQPSVAERSL